MEERVMTVITGFELQAGDSDLGPVGLLMTEHKMGEPGEVRWGPGTNLTLGAFSRMTLF